MLKKLSLEVDPEDLQDIIDSISHEMMFYERRYCMHMLREDHTYQNLKKMYNNFKSIL